jgi:hypothetical protein
MNRVCICELPHDEPLERHISGAYEGCYCLWCMDAIKEWAAKRDDKAQQNNDNQQPKHKSSS